MKIRIHGLLAAAALGLAHAQPPAINPAVGGSVDPTRGQGPARIVNRAERPQPTRPPVGAQQVLVLTVQLDVDKDAVRAARVASTRQIASYAPKVFARRSGPWEVIIEGDTRRSFFVDDPTWREAEADASSGQQYQWVRETGTIAWPLVVPLYADGRPLNAKSVTVRDTRSGKTILQTAL